MIIKSWKNIIFSIFLIGLLIFSFGCQEECCTTENSTGVIQQVE
jgi:hypothetical protein